MGRISKDKVKEWLQECVVRALEDILPYDAADGTAAVRRPMDEPADIRTMLDGIDWLAHIYGDRITPGCAAGVGYYVRVEDWYCGHPIFLLGTIYTLLLAGANIYIDYERSWPWPPDEEMCLSINILDVFIDMGLSKEKVFYPKLEPGVNKAERFIQQHADIRHSVFVGDCANSYSLYRGAAELGLAVHLPGAHLILTEYADAVRAAADGRLARFGEQCFQGLIDYEAYHGMDDRQNKAVGFDYGDLFWDISLPVREWYRIKTPKDKRIMIVFTDKAKGGIQLPAYTAECCRVIFEEDLNCDYPQYDFLQLIDEEVRYADKC